MDGAIFLQQVVNGMSLGGMYALIAIGYTMVYGVLRLINFAHADVMMVGAFSTLFLFSSVGLPFGVAVFLTLGLCGLFGMLIDRVAYRPLRQASKISMLITAIGVSFFLENLFNVLFGGSSRFFSAPDFFNQTRAFGSVIITNVAWIVPLIDHLINERPFRHSPDHGQLAIRPHAGNLLGIERQIVAQHPRRFFRRYLAHHGNIVQQRGDIIK